ncbi:MAG: LytTR family DNA-binding domain-containing protein [Oscillospiraceae bacterium]|nr:LytTR family DNA-binding domain-containing protein [Oscillospiraceae bacterium]
MNIAFCDDDIEELSTLVSLLEDYKNLSNIHQKIAYTAFQNPYELLESIENGAVYDLLILDILMPSLNGMELAKLVRKNDAQIKIIFLTSSPEFAVESYAVNAFYYTLKPIWKDKLYLLLNNIIQEITNEDMAYILVKSREGLVKVTIKKLEYTEIIGKTLFYHLTNGTIIASTGTLATLESELLNFECFTKPHRSYLVNMDHISTLSGKSIKMESGALLPLARANYAEVKKAYLAYSFKE